MANRPSLNAECQFCKIVKGDVPSFKLIETEYSCSVLVDVGRWTLSRGHALIIPKFHGEKLADIPDEYLNDTLTIAKKIAIAQGVEDYNILQNNGPLAHQEVKHAHFHVIPKPSTDEGLGIRWNSLTPSKEDLQMVFEEIIGRL
ncbi:hypothetical protein AGABI2DRAFT_137445 [Agaricus bisporus var. bisporus H97]|uniref:hypothetical protein n=1 Tax=Agaricus bisporus var. bisporus (strain H97 / ATCC MYA-4626 / FGSC 10389) TaxID=936046 RepID=UPI00029F56B6|nr:hypothetical protein AGABI2DRAFT_137445 [Agaricus bisporus var. bisporus H97]EKV45983.1 hypothetical protein AGABI2DRAFT_137445 [Agaricus bisporus var. bisporus H97]